MIGCRQGKDKSIIRSCLGQAGQINVRIGTRRNGTMAQRHNGVKGEGHNGATAQWRKGRKTQWRNGATVQWQTQKIMFIKNY